MEPSGIVPSGRDPSADRRTLRQQQKTGNAPFSLLLDDSLVRDDTDRLAVVPNAVYSIIANQVFGP